MVRMASLFTFGRWLGGVLRLPRAAIFSRPADGFPPQASSSEELLTLPGEIGQRGARLVVSLRAEPKTLNPLTAVDAPSREGILGAMQADLIHINRATRLTAPALSHSWKISPHSLDSTLT